MKSRERERHLGIISNVDFYRNIAILTSKFLINFNYFNNFFYLYNVIIKRDSGSRIVWKKATYSAGALE